MNNYKVKEESFVTVSDIAVAVLVIFMMWKVIDLLIF